jgi:hypothetical protein
MFSITQRVVARCAYVQPQLDGQEHFRICHQLISSIFLPLNSSTSIKEEICLLCLQEPTPIEPLHDEKRKIKEPYQIRLETSASRIINSHE